MALSPGFRRCGSVYVQHRDHAGNWRSRIVGADLAITLRPTPSIRRRPDTRFSDAVAPVTPERGRQGHLHGTSPES